MKGRLFSILILFAVLAAGFVKDQAGKNDDHILRVLTYNIHHCNPPSRPGFIDVNVIAKVIQESKADVVALQEVDVYTERSGKELHQARALAALTGMHSYFVKAIDYAGGEYGIAILSKYPVIDSAGYALPPEKGAGGEPRALASITVQLPGNRKVMIACTHLDLKPANRRLQVAKIIEILKAETIPVIIAGDFNALPGSEEIQMLDAAFKRTCGNCPFTIPEKEPNRTIDYIAYAPPSSFEVVEHKVIAEPYASDHLPVLAALKW